MSWKDMPLGEVLCPHDDWVKIESDKIYREVTVRLWGKGADLRRECLGAAIGAPTRNRIKSGQFIISKIDARNGAFALVPEFLDGSVVTSDFPAFEVNANHALPRFVDWLSKTETFIDVCRRASEGTTNRVRLKMERFLTTRIPLPPLDEQRRIVAKLDAATECIVRIEAAQSANAEDFDRALHAYFASTLSHAKWLSMSEVAPLAWRQIEIDPKKNYTEFGVRSFFKGIFLRREVPGTAFSWQQLYRLQAGDVVFSNIMAWEKAIAVARPENEGWVGNHRMLTCEPNQDIIIPSFLHHYFITPEGFDKILRASPGTAARNKTLKANDLMAIEVPVPPLPLQHAFDALCEKFARLRAAQQSRSADLAALMPALLDRAFKGEL